MGMYIRAGKDVSPPPTTHPGALQPRKLGQRNDRPLDSCDDAAEVNLTVSFFPEAASSELAEATAW